MAELQVAQLKRRLKDRESARAEQEKVRAANKVTLLEAELRQMKAGYEETKRKLLDRGAAHERELAQRNKEAASLRKAAEMARKRILEVRSWHGCANLSSYRCRHHEQL